MAGCCRHAYETAANRQFDATKVADEVRRYRENGPGRTTRLLADGIEHAGALGGSVLDIGAGFGGLTLALLERGAAHAVAVDASRAYIEAARQTAAAQGRTAAIDFVSADFVEAQSQLPAADIVTLDRVVCCYPSCETLLEAALGHARRCLALSYPRDVWYVHLGTRFENVRRRLARRTFRTFVHPASSIEALIGRAGFTLARRRLTPWWSADVYIRTRDPVRPRPQPPRTTGSGIS